MNGDTEVANMELLCLHLWDRRLSGIQKKLAQFQKNKSPLLQNDSFRIREI